MRKICFVLSLILLLSAFAGCAKNSETGNQEVVETVAGDDVDNVEEQNKVDSLEEHVLKIGIELVGKPYAYEPEKKNKDSYADYTGKRYIEGSNAKLAVAIAESLGYEDSYELHIMDSAATPLALENGVLDFVIANQTTSFEEKDKVLFSDSYASVNFVFVCGRDTEITAETRVVVEAADIAEEIAGRLGVAPVEVKSQANAIQLFTEKRADAMIIDKSAFKVFGEEYEDYKTAAPKGYDFTAESEYRITAAKTSTELIEKINAAIEDYHASLLNMDEK